MRIAPRKYKFLQLYLRNNLLMMIQPTQIITIQLANILVKPKTVVKVLGVLIN
jgi:hypothetical protein